jgi:hypothetical protein
MGVVMTCKNQCQGGQCPHLELCASYDNAHAVLMVFTWFCLVLLTFFGWALFVFLS